MRFPISDFTTFQIPVSSAVSSSTPNRSRRVAPESVPACPRHSDRMDALYEARALSVFLQEAVERLLSPGDFLFPEDVPWGARLCFDLLNDKLAIALGERDFPFTKYGADAVLRNSEQEDSSHA